MKRLEPVLVLEDNPLLADAAREMLAVLGVDHIIVVRSFEFAIAHARAEPIRFALLSAALDDGDVRPLVTLLAVRGIPYALVSDFADGRDIPRGLGGTPFLTRPYNQAELARVIEGFLL